MLHTASLRRGSGVRATPTMPPSESYGGTTKASSLTAGIAEVINPAATGLPSWSAPGAVGADAPGVVVNGCRGAFLDSRYSLTQLLSDQLVDVDGGRVLGGQGLGGRLTGRADSAVPDDHLTAVAGELSEPPPPPLDDIACVEAGSVGDVRQVRARPEGGVDHGGLPASPPGHHRSGQFQLRQGVLTAASRRTTEGMVVKIEKELQRVDLFRIGEQRRRFRWSGRAHRAPPDARELRKLNGSGSPAIVAVWFAWWYLRPTDRTIVRTGGTPDVPSSV